MYTCTCGKQSNFSIAGKCYECFHKSDRGRITLTKDDANDIINTTIDGYHKNIPVGAYTHDQVKEIVRVALNDVRLTLINHLRKL